MQKNDNHNYLFSITAGEDLAKDRFDVEFYQFNRELCCEGSPIKVVKNFDELLSLIEEWEE